MGFLKAGFFIVGAGPASTRRFPTSLHYEQEQRSPTDSSSEFVGGHRAKKPSDRIVQGTLTVNATA
jgi:hypothetical protein